jgi:protein O-GlcNAc transferase
MNDQRFITAQEHQAAGRPAQAEAIYREILAQNPRDSEALGRLGLIYLEQKRFDEAIRHFGSGLEERPDSPALWSHLGIALQESGRSKEAIEAFRMACDLRPSAGQLFSNLGNALWQAGQLTQAEVICRKAIELKPDLPEAWGNLGNVLLEKDELAEAVEALQNSVRLRPDFAAGFYNLGRALNSAHRFPEAVAAFGRAVELRPDDLVARNYLGCAFLSASEPEAAEAVFANLVKAKPEDAYAWNNLASSLKSLGRMPEAIQAYRRAIELRPDAADIHSNMIYDLYYHETDPETIYRELRTWNHRHCKPLHDRIKPLKNDKNPQRRLRVGYVSADFWDHASAYFLDPLLRSHDHKQFEIFCYAQMVRTDWVTRRLQTYADHWLDTRPFDDETLAERIRKDQIDILVDLKLHCVNNRSLVFARKPAPVEVVWLGYPDSTGLETMDYRLTDRYLENEASPYSMPEKRIFLPDCFWCYDPLTTEPAPSPLPATSMGYVTFGCLNAFNKVTETILSLWGRILRAVPRSRLVLLTPPGAARERVMEALTRDGADPAAVEFVSRMFRPDYLATYRRIDIGLDTFPYNGHTTSLDAFWMGVPSVTLAGRGPLSRGTWSQLCNLGLQDFAATDPEGYVRLAVAKASDLRSLAALRQVLRDRMEHSPLMDANRFAQAVEGAYWRMWKSFHTLKD